MDDAEKYLEDCRQTAIEAAIREYFKGQYQIVDGRHNTNRKNKTNKRNTTNKMKGDNTR